MSGIFGDGELPSGVKLDQGQLQAEPSQTRTAGGKVKSPFFAAVRQRGTLNAIVDIPAMQYEKANPGMRCRWEYSPPAGDNSAVVAREAMGFKIVDASELGGLTDSQQKTGPIRRGDLILMACPEELFNELAQEDADAAEQDKRLPEETYRQHIEALTVQKRDGTVVRSRSTGSVKTSIETESINVGGSRPSE